MELLEIHYTRILGMGFTSTHPGILKPSTAETHHSCIKQRTLGMERTPSPGQKLSNYSSVLMQVSAADCAAAAASAAGLVFDNTACISGFKPSHTQRISSTTGMGVP